MLRVLRHSLYLLGDIFQGLQFSSLMTAIIAIVGIVLPLFSRQELANIPNSKFDTSLQIIESIISVFVIIFVFVIVVQFLGAFFYWLGEQVPASIDIIPAHTVDNEFRFNESLQKTIEYWYADLRIVNREYEELTECYAILRAVYVYDPAHGFTDLSSWFFAGISHMKLQWKNSNDCEIKIGPRTGQEILRVYRLGVDNDDLSCVVQDFNICDKNYKGMKNSNTEFYIVIEVYGKLKNRDIKPKIFYSFVKIEFSKTDSGASYSLDIWKADKKDEKSLRAKIVAA